MNIPEGYIYEPSPSAFPNHIGKLFQKPRTVIDGIETAWVAMHVEEHHVNAWGLAHGALMASLAEMGTASAAWDPEGPPVVAIEMSMQYIKAPKLGQLIEVCGTCTRRTRSIVFSEAKAYVEGELVFSATSVQKIINA